MRNGWDSTRWDEDWAEPYLKERERLKRQAETNHANDPVPGYGLDEDEGIVEQQEPEQYTPNRGYMRR